MAKLRNKRKLAVVAGETQQAHHWKGQRLNTSVPGCNNEYITQKFEEIGDRVARKTSREFSETKSHIFCFYVVCLTSTNISSTHRYGQTAEPFREHSGTQSWKTRRQMGIFPRMIFIVTWDPPSITPVIHLIQTQTRRLTDSNLFQFCKMKNLKVRFQAPSQLISGSSC